MEDKRKRRRLKRCVRKSTDGGGGVIEIEG